ncbi:hypothetical protein RQP46_007001 [Phenoliferia psychrophenolica]
MSRLATLDPKLRLLIALAAKVATLGILAGRYPATISLDEADYSADPEALSDLAREQQRAKELLQVSKDGSHAWLARVCSHLEIDLLSLPDEPVASDFLPGDVAVESHFDISQELVLVSVGLAEAAADASEKGKGKAKEPEGALVYLALERALVVRTAATLGIETATVEGAEKAIAQFLFFQLPQEEAREDGEKGSKAWDEAARAKKDEASKKNKMLKWAATGTGFVVGGVLIGLTGGLGAPLLAPFLVGGLGLSFLGGAGGAILIGTLLGLGGGGLAGYRTHRRLKGIDEISFEQLKTPDVPAIPSLLAHIVVSGFLLDPEDSVEPWRATFEKSHLDTFALKVDTATFLSAGNSMDKYLRNKILQVGGKEVLKASALSALYAGVALPLTIFAGASTILDSDFSRCRDKAQKAGLLLAEILEKKVQGSRPCILVGYGPGATIIFEALLELHRRKLGSLVFTAILISLPSSPNRVKWASARSVVAHRLVNCYSTNDWVLAISARLYTLSARVAGMQSVEAEGVENVDCSDLVAGHLELRGHITKILERVDKHASA